MTQPAKRTVGKLDQTDIRLVREIFQGRTALPVPPDFRKSFRDIARIMEIDEDTVRRRVARLEGGFIRGWHLILNPNVLGMVECALDFDVPTSILKDEIIRKLKLVPGVFLIANFYSRLLAVIFRCEGDETLRRTINLVQELTHATVMHCAKDLWPECRTNLSKIDWKIIACLHQDLRKSLTSISEEAGISTRTAHRRLHRMLSNMLLFALADIDPKALDGTILANMGVGYESQDGIEVRRRVTTRWNEFLWHVYQTAPMNETELQYTYFNLALPNVPKAREISDWVREQEGVKICRMEFYEDHLILSDSLNEQIRRSLPRVVLS